MECGVVRLGWRVKGGQEVQADGCGKVQQGVCGAVVGAGDGSFSGSDVYVGCGVAAEVGVVHGEVPVGHGRHAAELQAHVSTKLVRTGLASLPHLQKAVKGRWAARGRWEHEERTRPPSI